MVTGRQLAMSSEALHLLAKHMCYIIGPSDALWSALYWQANVWSGIMIIELLVATWHPALLCCCLYYV